MATKPPVIARIPCPRCGQGYNRDNYSTSRRDNETNICPSCSTSEAVYDFLVAIGRSIPEDVVVREQMFYLYRMTTRRS